MVKPEVGQTVLASIRKKTPVEATVTKVGRECFYAVCPPYGEAKFYIETWKEAEEYSSFIWLFPTVQDYRDMLESDRLIIMLSTHNFRLKPHLSLDSLRRIAAIIEGDENG